MHSAGGFGREFQRRATPLAAFTWTLGQNSHLPRFALSPLGMPQAIELCSEAPCAHAFAYIVHRNCLPAPHSRLTTRPAASTFLRIVIGSIFNPLRRLCVRARPSPGPRRLVRGSPLCNQKFRLLLVSVDFVGLCLSLLFLLSFLFFLAVHTRPPPPTPSPPPFAWLVGALGWWSVF